MARSRKTTAAKTVTHLADVPPVKCKGVKAKGKSTAAEGQPGAIKVASVPVVPSELVVLTGLSGAGKASAMKAFEDLGFYAVDNLPLELFRSLQNWCADRMRFAGLRLWWMSAKARSIDFQTF